MIDCDKLMQILGDRGGGDGRSGGLGWFNEANYERWALCKNKGNIMMMIRDDGDYCSGVYYVVRL